MKCKQTVKVAGSAGTHGMKVSQMVSAREVWREYLRGSSGGGSSARVGHSGRTHTSTCRRMPAHAQQACVLCSRALCLCAAALCQGAAVSKWAHERGTGVRRMRSQPPVTSCSPGKKRQTRFQLRNPKPRPPGEH